MIKSKRHLDPQGRVILPVHIRRALNLTEGSVVDIDMTEDGTIRIYPVTEHCCICGDDVEGQPHASITIRSETKHICSGCATRINHDLGVWPKETLKPHGRLIDADALIESLEVDPVECPGCPEPEYLGEIVELLSEAPTVIEAEGEDE